MSALSSCQRHIVITGHLSGVLGRIDLEAHIAQPEKRGEY
jgi:hypothetical protein